MLTIKKTCTKELMRLKNLLKENWLVLRYSLSQYWPLLLLFPYLLINLVKWHYDIVSPYSNFWSNSDSLGPLLWIKGEIFASDDTSWGRLVKATTLPSLYAISYVLDLIGKTPFDFQKYIVFANILISIIICVVVGKKLFKSIFLGLCLPYLFISGYYAYSTMLGYGVSFRYGVWSSYGAFSGILSMNLGALILLIYICNYQWVSIALSILLTFFHPATGAIVALLLLVCLFVENYLIEPRVNPEAAPLKTLIRHGKWKLQTLNLIKYLLLVLPIIFMFLWTKVANIDSYPKNFPWREWWGWICGYIYYHVVPWRVPGAVANYLASILLASSIAFFIYKKQIIRNYFKEIVIIAFSFLLVIISFLSSEVFHSYYLTSFYLHRGSAFGGVLLAVLICRLWSDKALDEQSRPIAAITILLLTLPPTLPSGYDLSFLGFTQPYELAEKLVILEIIIAWITLGCDRFTSISKLWFPITIVSCITLSLARMTIVGVLGALLLSCYWFRWKTISHRVLVIFLLVPLIVFLSPSYIEAGKAAKFNSEAVYPTIADPALDPRADIFQWIRLNTDKQDLILDPPSNPQTVPGRSIPDIGYNQLLSLREHLLNMKEFHVSVYIKSIYPITIRDVKDIYNFSDTSNCRECFIAPQLYKHIDDSRLRLLVNKHPRLKYFVRQKDTESTPVSFPIVYENQNFAIHQLR